ncbi:MAG: Rne/Rng family ribonuclease [Candidatus Latescibacteria bacterium]|nr:Rne/Rng family ribonuclease [Candidatus Latescibacterota bacterium]
MKTDIIINATTHETRIAIIEEDKTVEIWVERPDNERMVGDIYKGKVKAVIPGIQAAFVDIGMEKSAFLHVSDVSDSSIDFVAQYEDDDFDDEKEEEEEEEKEEKSGQNAQREKGRRRGRDKRMQPIESILKKDQELLVQVTKEPISTKGARVTSQISLPGRFLVMMPGSNKAGVSRKIASWDERKRLRRIARKYKPKGVGLIIRTVTSGKDEDVIAAEIKELTNTYENFLKTFESVKAPALIHKAMGMTSGIIRDLLSDDVEKVVVDSEEHYEEIRRYLESTSPKLIHKVSLYKEKEPIFDHFGLEEEIDKIFSRKVWLKTGAFLVFDQTEALHVIDVNSGRNTGKSNQEETIFNINLESAIEIARQLRLRDIGGIIVIDFIDMMNMDHRRKLEDTFADALKNDRSKISISQLSEFGLMEMTRQRVRPSLIHTFAESCPTCGGIGMVQGRDTTVTKIERWLARAEAFGSGTNYTVFVHPAVFEYLIKNDHERLETLRSCTKLTIDIVADSKIGIDEYHCFSNDGGGDVTEDFVAGKKNQDKIKSTNGKKSAPKTITDKQPTMKYGRRPKPKRR